MSDVAAAGFVWLVTVLADSLGCKPLHSSSVFSFAHQKVVRPTDFRLTPTKSTAAAFWDKLAIQNRFHIDCTAWQQSGGKGRGMLACGLTGDMLRSSPCGRFWKWPPCTEFSKQPPCRGYWKEPLGWGIWEWAGTSISSLSKVLVLVLRVEMTSAGSFQDTVRRSRSDPTSLTCFHRLPSVFMWGEASRAWRTGR